VSASIPLVYETHLHTPLCGHARGEPSEYAEQALRRGLKGMTVTCHAPLPDGYSPRVRMRREQWQEYVDLVQATREQYADQVEVLLGVESDFMPGLEPWLEALHDREPLHYVIGSVHPQTDEYQQRYFQGDWKAFQRQYFTSLAEAAETGLFDCISHPDLVKNLSPETYEFEELRDVILRALDRIAETGVAMELNTSGLFKRVPEMNPSLAMLEEMNIRNIRVVVGADAHVPERVGDHYLTAYDLLNEAGYDSVFYFKHREPVELPIEKARASLKVTSS